METRLGILWLKGKSLDFLYDSQKCPSYCLTHSAQLRTTVPLDYDLRTSGTRAYSLTVSVNDTEHVDFVEIAVQVLDINDNDPEFSNETYR